MVIINGEEKDVAGKSVSEYLAIANFNMARIVVERNGEIVPKADYDSTVLADGDEIEVVSFVGGG